MRIDQRCGIAVVVIAVYISNVVVRLLKSRVIVVIVSIDDWPKRVLCHVHCSDHKD